MEAIRLMKRQGLACYVRLEETQCHKKKSDPKKLIIFKIMLKIKNLIKKNSK